MQPSGGQKDLLHEIEDLEKQIEERQARLQELKNGCGASILVESSNPTSIHALLLLSDTALPLGSFAYSSGLESFLAHRKQSTNLTSTTLSDFQSFLHLSISSVAHTNVPYLLAAYRDAERLEELDNDIDASTPCAVARRASIAQGRALIGVWERSFRAYWSDGSSTDRHAAVTALKEFSRAMKLTSDVPLSVNGHFAPVWGATTCAMGIDAHQASYVFLINHAKAVLSAAVRASVMGPYQAQSFLAGTVLQEVVAGCVERVWNTSPENAGQVVPALDLWVGRHELLYSRIFNS